MPNVASSATASRLNQELENFERQTSSQILVVIYPKMQSDSSIDDYTVRVYRAWKPGQKDKNNGAILFVFVQDHRLRIATGYGLEGALPDALGKRIIDTEIAPRFKQGDFDGGLNAGVAAMIAAAKGEYKGTGRTVADSAHRTSSFLANYGFIILIILLILIFGFEGSRGYGGGIWMLGSGGFGGWSGGGGGGGGWSGGGGGVGRFFPEAGAAPAAAGPAAVGDL